MGFILSKLHIRWHDYLKTRSMEIFLPCFYLVIIIVIEKFISDKHVETI